MIILLLFAFLSGIITVLSPCILPILPILLASGFGEGHKRPLGIIVGFILSFTLFALFLTITIHSFNISPNFLRYFAITLIIFFGLTMLSKKLERFFSKLTSSISSIGNKFQNKVTGNGFASGFLLGTAIGLIWTPCAGPILASIIILIATQSITWQIILLTFAYTIGTSIPMFLIAYGGNKIMTATNFLTNYTEIIRKVFAILMILGAISIALHFDVYLQQITMKYLPAINIENNEMVTKELKKLESKNLSGTNKSPEFAGIAHWINSLPLTLEQLKGKIVLIDFWTYSCINCIRTLPHIKEWHAKYKDKNFVVIGVHTPEFEFEKKISNVENAVKRFGITYPVALDNNYKTWLNFNNHYWPAHYLIDQNGLIRKFYFGEGHYIELENDIRDLLNLMPIVKEEKKEINLPVTPETYLGYLRAQRYNPEIKLINDKVQDYNYKNHLQTDEVGIKGLWLVSPEYIESKSDNSILELNFTANRVYLVMESEKSATVEILLDNKFIDPEYYTKDMGKNGKIVVNEAKMYDIIDLKGKDGTHKLTLKIPTSVKAFAFTFGQGKN